MAAGWHGKEADMGHGLKTVEMAAPRRKEGDRPADPYQLQSLDRAVAVLELLGESEGPLGLADVASAWRCTKAPRIARSWCWNAAG